MGSRGSSSGKGGGGGKSANSKTEIKNIQNKIDALTAENANLLKREYSGKKGWSKQLDADIKKAKNNNTKIQKLESQKKKLQQGTAKEKTKSKQSTSSQWQKAGEGWYVGSSGHEIRQNYNTGGFDVVKVNKSGDVVKQVKHFSKLSEARKYNP